MIFDRDDLKVYLQIFTISEFYNSSSQLFESEEQKSAILAKEMYYGLIIPRVKQYKTIHIELKITYL